MERLNLMLVVPYVLLWTHNALCLKQNQSLQIVGGVETIDSRFGYMVGITAYEELICSGGIISDFHVLTCVHCFVKFYEGFEYFPYHVVAGRIDLWDENTGFDIPISEIYIPKSYNRFSAIPDIAVVRLKKSLFVSYYPELAKLQLPDENMETIVLGQLHNMSGYGVSNFDVVFNEKNKLSICPTNAGKLKYLTCKIISIEVCQQYREYTINEEHQVCCQALQTNKNPTGTSMGDSGGPLVTGNTVIGVTHRSPKWGETYVSTAYTRVDRNLRFINSAISGDPDSDLVITFGEKNYWFHLEFAQIV